jgi:hypothetical protein
MAHQNTPVEYDDTLLEADLDASSFDFSETWLDFDWSDLLALLADQSKGETESSPKEVQNIEKMSESKGTKAVASSKKSINLQYVEHSIQDFLTGKLPADIQRVNKLTGDLHI